MGLFDWFSAPRKIDATFGSLVYRRGEWNGEVLIPELCEQPIRLTIWTARDTDLTPFASIINCLRENLDTIKRQVALEAFEMYELYIREERVTGIFTDADYANHPIVTSAADIWRVLKPTELTVTNVSRDYNAILWLDVDWPNPHSFAAHLKNSELYHLEVGG